MTFRLFLGYCETSAFFHNLCLIRPLSFWVSSDSPGLSAKVIFYGLYYFNEGQVKIWPYPKGNKEHTVNVLERIRLDNPNRDIGIIWDGASDHKAIIVQEVAKQLRYRYPLTVPILCL
ncbi:hypothetical protein [Endozoicomonas sp. Mp262]|uniref:hypothetical protein n=1 Tax=Endozoicomonas sp. Mp262 TaxID=2919499 RepID=UPI0021DAB2B5